ncbi:hypothetical protein BC940DRAFT_153553 [Gongronella butleri]|nr:hypothetical protein BC940DRAFT_153553 [Gongronella butleri]
MAGPLLLPWTESIFFPLFKKDLQKHALAAQVATFFFPRQASFHFLAAPLEYDKFLAGDFFSVYSQISKIFNTFMPHDARRHAAMMALGDGSTTIEKHPMLSKNRFFVFSPFFSLFFIAKFIAKSPSVQNPAIGHAIWSIVMKLYWCFDVLEGAETRGAVQNPVGGGGRGDKFILCRASRTAIATTAPCTRTAAAKIPLRTIL